MQNKLTASRASYPDPELTAPQVGAPVGRTCQPDKGHFSGAPAPCAPARSWQGALQRVGAFASASRGAVGLRQRAARLRLDGPAARPRHARCVPVRPLALLPLRALAAGRSVWALARDTSADMLLPLRYPRRSLTQLCAERVPRRSFRCACSHPGRNLSAHSPRATHVVRRFCLRAHATCSPARHNGLFFLRLSARAARLCSAQQTAALLSQRPWAPRGRLKPLPPAFSNICLPLVGPSGRSGRFSPSSLSSLLSLTFPLSLLFLSKRSLRGHSWERIDTGCVAAGVARPLRRTCARAGSTLRSILRMVAHTPLALAASPAATCSPARRRYALFPTPRHVLLGTTPLRSPALLSLRLRLATRGACKAPRRSGTTSGSRLSGHVVGPCCSLWSGFKMLITRVPFPARVRSHGRRRGGPGARGVRL